MSLATGKPHGNPLRTLRASLDALAVLPRKSLSGKRVLASVEKLLEAHNEQRSAIRKEVKMNTEKNKASSTMKKRGGTDPQLPISLPDYNGVLELVGCNDLTQEEWSAIIAIIATHMNIASIDVTLCTMLSENKSVRNGFIDAVKQNTSIIDVQSDSLFITNAVATAIAEHKKLADLRDEMRQMANQWQSVSDIENIFKAQRVSAEENEQSIRQLIEHQWLCAVVPPFERFRAEAVKLVLSVNSRQRREVFLDNVDAIVTDSCVTLPNRLFGQFMERLANLTEHLESNLRSEVVSEQLMMRNAIRRRYFKCHEQAANKLLGRFKNEHQMRVDLLADCLSSKERTIVSHEASQRAIIYKFRNRGTERLEDFELNLLNRKQEIQTKVSSRIEEFQERQKMKAERIAKEQGGKGNVTLIVEIDRQSRSEQLARAKLVQDEDKTFDMYCELLLLCRKLSDAREAISEASANVQTVLDNRKYNANESHDHDLEAIERGGVSPAEKKLSRSPSPRINPNRSPSISTTIATPRLNGFPATKVSMPRENDKNEVSMPFAGSDLSISAFKSLQLSDNAGANSNHQAVTPIVVQRKVVELPVVVDSFVSLASLSHIGLFKPNVCPIPTIEPVEIRGGLSTSRLSVLGSKSSVPQTSRGMASSRSRSPSLAYGSPLLAAFSSSSAVAFNPISDGNSASGIVPQGESSEENMLISALEVKDTIEEGKWRESFSTALCNLAVVCRYNNAIITKVTNQMESILGKIYATLVLLQPAPLEHIISAPVSASSVFGIPHTRSLRAGGRARSQSLLTNESRLTAIATTNISTIEDTLLSSNIELESSRNFDLAATTGKLGITGGRRDSGSNNNLLLTSVSSSSLAINASPPLRRQRTLTAPPAGALTNAPLKPLLIVDAYRDILRKKFFPLTETFLHQEDATNTSLIIDRLTTEAIAQRRIVRKIIIIVSDQEPFIEAPTRNSVLERIGFSHPGAAEVSNSEPRSRRTFVISTICQLEDVSELVANHMYILPIEANHLSGSLIRLEVNCVMLPITWRHSKLTYVASSATSNGFDDSMAKLFFPWVPSVVDQMKIKARHPAQQAGKIIKKIAVKSQQSSNPFQLNEENVVKSETLLRVSVIKSVFEAPVMGSGPEHHYHGKYAKPFEGLIVNAEALQKLLSIYSDEGSPDAASSENSPTNTNDAVSDGSMQSASPWLSTVTLTISCHGPPVPSALTGLPEWDGQLDDLNLTQASEMSTSTFSPGDSSRKDSEGRLTSTATPATVAMIASFSPEAAPITPTKQVRRVSLAYASASGLNASETMSGVHNSQQKAPQRTLRSCGGLLLGNNWRSTIAPLVASTSRKRSVTSPPMIGYEGTANFASTSSASQHRFSIASASAVGYAVTAVGYNVTSTHGSATQAYDVHYQATTSDEANKYQGVSISVTNVSQVYPAAQGVPFVEGERLASCTTSLSSFTVSFSLKDRTLTRQLVPVIQSFLQDLHFYYPPNAGSPTIDETRPLLFATVKLVLPSSKSSQSPVSPQRDLTQGFGRSYSDAGAKQPATHPFHLSHDAVQGSAVTVAIVHDDLPSNTQSDAPASGVVTVLRDENCAFESGVSPSGDAQVAALEIHLSPAHPSIQAANRIVIERRSSMASAVRSVTELYGSSSTSNQRKTTISRIGGTQKGNKTNHSTSSPTTSDGATLQPPLLTVNEMIASLKDDKAEGLLVWNKMAGPTLAMEAVQKRHHQLMMQNNNYEQLEFLNTRHQLLRRHSKYTVFNLGDNVKVCWGKGAKLCKTSFSTTTFAICFEIQTMPSDRLTLNVSTAMASSSTAVTKAIAASSPQHITRGDLLAFLPPYPLSKQSSFMEDGQIVHFYHIKDRRRSVRDEKSDVESQSSTSLSELADKSTKAEFSDTNPSSILRKVPTTQNTACNESDSAFDNFSFLSLQCYSNMLSEGIATSTAVTTIDRNGGYPGLLKIQNTAVEASSPIPAPSSQIEASSEATSRSTSPAATSAPTPTKEQPKRLPVPANPIPRFSKINLIGQISSEIAEEEIQAFIDSHLLPYIKLLSGPTPKDRAVKVVATTFVSKDLDDRSPEMPWNQLPSFGGDITEPVEELLPTAVEDFLCASSRTLATDVNDRSSRKMSVIFQCDQSKGNAAGGTPMSRRKSFSTSFRAQEPSLTEDTAENNKVPSILSMPCGVPLIDYLTRYGASRSATIPLTVAHCKLWNATAAKNSTSNNSSLTTPPSHSGNAAALAAYGELTVKVTSDKSSQLSIIGIDDNLFIVPDVSEQEGSWNLSKSKSLMKSQSPNSGKGPSQSDLTVRIDCTAASECIFRFENSLRACTLFAEGKEAHPSANAFPEDAFNASMTTGNKPAHAASPNASITDSAMPSLNTATPDPIIYIDMTNKTVTYLPTAKVIATIHVTGGRAVPDFALNALTAAYYESVSSQQQVDAPNAGTQKGGISKSAIGTSAAAPLSLGARRSSYKTLPVGNSAPLPPPVAAPFITALESVIEIRFVPDFLECIMKTSSPLSQGTDPSDNEASLNNTIGASGSATEATSKRAATKQAVYSQTLAPHFLFTTAKSILSALLRTAFYVSRIPPTPQAFEGTPNVGNVTSRGTKSDQKIDVDNTQQEKLVQYALLSATSTAGDTDGSYLGIKLLCS